MPTRIRPPKPALPLPALALLGACLALASPASAEVFEVGGTAPLKQVQEAVDLAQDGDVILLFPQVSLYQAFEIVDKSLTIVGDGPALVAGGIVVRDLAPQRAVVLQNVSVASGGGGLHALEITDCAGAVVVENGSFTPLHGSGTTRHGAYIEASTAVSLVNCAFQGGGAQSCEEGSCHTTPGAGVFVVGSRVSIESCSILGATGGSSEFGGAAGAPALRAVDSAPVHLAGSTLQGGQGGLSFGVGPGQPGGPAAELLDSVVRLRESELSGGLHGTQGFVAPKLALLGDAQVVTADARATGLATNSPVREGQQAVLEAQGRPGDAAFLLVSTAPAWFDAPAYAGVFQLGPLLVAKPLPLGAFAGDGALDLRALVPPLDPLEGLVLHLQVFTQGAAGPRLGPALPLVLLDGAF